MKLGSSGVALRNWWEPDVKQRYHEQQRDACSSRRGRWAGTVRQKRMLGRGLYDGQQKVTKRSVEMR